MKRSKMNGLMLAMVSAALMVATVPKADAIELFLAGKRITAGDTRIPGNDLVPSPPLGPLTVIVPDSTEASTAVWRSAPLKEAVVLLPGTVTLSLLVKNYRESLTTQDVFFSKRISLKGETPGALLIATGAFENPFPPMGSGTCPLSIILGQSPPAVNCVPQGLMVMNATSTVLTPIVIPAGSVVEVRVWCPPQFSSIGAFFNASFHGNFSTIEEPEAATVKEGRLTGGGTTSGLFDAAGVTLPVLVDVHQGLELHCNAAQLPNNLEVNWDGGNHFHLSSLTSATCFDDPSKMPNPPPAGFDSYIGSGGGECNGVPGATANWYFTDEGEPGTSDDVVSLKITCADGSTVTAGGQNNLQGNFQAHAQ
jgi:hypothetical protein